jgi:hypothetical protein
MGECSENGRLRNTPCRDSSVNRSNPPLEAQAQELYSSKKAVLEGRDNVFCAVLIRRLKEGASFEDFRKAWEPQPGHFGRQVQLPTLVASTMSRRLFRSA